MSGEAVIEGGGLRVDFTRADDRFAHVIGWLNEVPGGGLEFVPLLESVEGTADDNWPASPPLQSLHVEDRPDGKRLALLVGMAGRSHWSASLEFDPALGKATWDVACRLHAEPAALTSTYRVVEAKLLSVSDSSVRLSSGSRCFELQLEGSDQHSCTLNATSPTQLTIQCFSPPGLLPRTVRWRYTLKQLS